MFSNRDETLNLTAVADRLRKIESNARDAAEFIEHIRILEANNQIIRDDKNTCKQVKCKPDKEFLNVLARRRKAWKEMDEYIEKHILLNVDKLK